MNKINKHFKTQAWVGGLTSVMWLPSLIYFQGPGDNYIPFYLLLFVFFMPYFHFINPLLCDSIDKL